MCSCALPTYHTMRTNTALSLWREQKSTAKKKKLLPLLMSGVTFHWTDLNSVLKNNFKFRLKYKYFFQFKFVNIQSSLCNSNNIMDVMSNIYLCRKKSEVSQSKKCKQPLKLDSVARKQQVEHKIPYYQFESRVSI